MYSNHGIYFREKTSKLDCAYLTLIRYPCIHWSLASNSPLICPTTNLEPEKTSTAFTSSLLTIIIPASKVWETSKVASQKREIFGVLFKAPLFLGNWSGVTTYFLYEKVRKTNYKIHDWTASFIDWIRKIHVLINLKFHSFGSQSQITK